MLIELSPIMSRYIHTCHTRVHHTRYLFSFMYITHKDFLFQISQKPQATKRPQNLCRLLFEMLEHKIHLFFECVLHNTQYIVMRDM